MTPALSISVGFSVETGRGAAMSSSTYQLDGDTRLESETNGWMTDTRINRAGVAIHNGLFVDVRPEVVAKCR